MVPPSIGRGTRQAEVVGREFESGRKGRRRSGEGVESQESKEGKHVFGRRTGFGWRQKTERGGVGRQDNESSRQSATGDDRTASAIASASSASTPAAIGGSGIGTRSTPHLRLISHCCPKQPPNSAYPCSLETKPPIERFFHSLYDRRRRRVFRRDRGEQPPKPRREFFVYALCRILIFDASG